MHSYVFKIRVLIVSFNVGPYQYGTYYIMELSYVPNILIQKFQIAYGEMENGETTRE